MNEFYNRYIIKFSKQEYLEQIKKGQLYFKEAQYFKNIEKNNVGDSHEGTIIIDQKTFPKKGNIFDLLINDKMEFNLLRKSNKKTPLFCCSILNENVLIQIEKNKCIFKKEFVDEMNQWGNDFIIIDIKELLSKLNTRCKDLNIVCIYDLVEYDHEERMMTYDEAISQLYEEPFMEFFNKNKKYMWQNEFRIIVSDEYNQLISNDSDHYILDIGELKTAQIMNSYDLNNCVIEFKNNDK